MARMVLCLAGLGVAAQAAADGLAFAAPPAVSRAAAAETVQAASLRRGPAPALDEAAAAQGASAYFALAVGAAFGLAAASKVAGSRRRASRVQRGVTIGMREYAQHTGKFEEADKPKVRKHHTPGQHGYSTLTPGYKPAPAPARQALSRVADAKAKFVPSDFYKAPSASLKMSDVKQVGTYMTAADARTNMISPASVPAYVKPPVGSRLEKEKGTTRSPTGSAEYKTYAENRCNLVAAAQKACPGSLGKDFIADRSALMVLLNYLNETLSGELMRQGQEQNPLDFVKVSKSGSALVLERLFEKKNMWAEFRPYRGGWKRSEVSNHGDFMPAWERLATGGHEKTMMVTGLRQIAGSVAGESNRLFRFVEYTLGGMSLLTRVPTHAATEGKNVELAHKNWYYRDKVTCMDTYQKMVLGGVDVISMALQRSGKVTTICEMTADGLAAKQPGAVDAAERRFGRLAALLEKVKAAADSAGGEGPWVLQWQRGELVLGDYKEVAVEPMKKEELTMA